MWHSLRKQTIFVRSISLMIFEICLFAVITPFLWYFGPAWSFVAAGAAVGVCSAGALLAIWINYFLCDPKYALTALLLGMAVNMGVPLAFAVAVQLLGGPLSQAGFLYYLVFFYLLTLGVKTILCLPLPQQRAADNHAS
jgi:hypothetical protein